MHIVARIMTGLSIVLLLASCGVWLLLSAPRAGLEALTIPTGSMRPSMPAGSLALIRQVPASSLRVGDIITYADPFNAHKTITHRIIKTYTIADKIPGFMTKGDANSTPDLPIPAGSVQGKVFWHVPYAGSVLSWARSWAGITVLVYLPALLVMIEEIKRLRDYYRSLLPYRLASYERHLRQPVSLPKLAAGPLAGVVMTGVLMGQPVASALFSSNVAALTDNTISAAVVAPPPSGCRNNTNISVNNNTSQTAVSGSVSNNGSTNGPGATGGNVSNTQTTNTTVTVNNTGC